MDEPPAQVLYIQELEMADNRTTQEYAMQRAREKRAQDYFDMFKENEGYKPKVYTDTKGKRTIGIGFNLEDGGNRRFLKKIGIDVNELFAGRELNDEEIRTLYNHSLTQAFGDAKKFDPQFNKRPEPVKKAIVDMAFNLGLTKLNKFERMNAALGQNDYKAAADEMVDSKWYKDVKTRGPRTVELMASAAR
jgi:lysozyme